jgi:hypothetical protein
MTVKLLLAMVMGDNTINNSKKCRKITGNFDHHGDAAVCFGAHCPMEHNKGFTKNHWMLPLGKCLCRIAPVAAMVGNFGGKHKKLTKTTFS